MEIVQSVQDGHQSRVPAHAACRIGVAAYLQIQDRSSPTSLLAEVGISVDRRQPARENVRDIDSLPSLQTISKRDEKIIRIVRGEAFHFLERGDAVAVV